MNIMTFHYKYTPSGSAVAGTDACIGNHDDNRRRDRRGLAAMLLLLALCPVLAFSQTGRRTVGGTVVDAKTGKAVSYVTVKAVDKADSLLSYATTGGDGAFTLPLPDGTAAVEFTLMGYDRKRIGAEHVRQGMRVSLAPSGIMLKELTVKARPMERRKDTINYNVAAFKGKEDRYIEDVLKKLPGIEVADNGAISYQGKPINKFNIEGQDLLGNQYNQATRNLPADAVATVQVMENDQPVRALKDRVPSDKATLNIKLKPDYKLRPFGDAVGGIGGVDKVLWNNRLTLIGVGRTNQAFVTARMNNNGENLSGDTEEHIDYSDIFNYEPLPPAMISTSGSSTPPVSEKRYLRNKSYSVGLNFLRRAGRYGSLRANVTYYGTSDRSKDSTYNYYGGNEPLALYEANRRKLRVHTLMPRVRYEFNAPKVYFVDELSGSLSFFKSTSRRGTSRQGGLTQQASNDVFEQTSDELTSEQGEMSRQLIGQTSSSARSLSARQLSERAVSHPGYIQNKLSMIINVGRKSFSVNSLTRYFRRSETLNVAYDDSDLTGISTYSITPSLLYSSLPSGEMNNISTYSFTSSTPSLLGNSPVSQSISLERIMTRNSIGTRFYIGRNSLELRYTFELRTDNVSAGGGDGFRTTSMKHSLSPEYILNYRRGHVTFDLPVNVFTSRIAWSGAGSSTKVYASPSVSWRHEFSPFWRMNLSGGLGRDASADVMLPEEYYSGYRTRVLTADRIGWTRSARASVSLGYANVVTMFVWNVMAMASWNTADHYNEYTYGERFTTVRTVWDDVKTRMLFFMTSADKTFTRIGLSLKSTLNYNRTTLPVAQNGVKTGVTSNVLAAAMTLRWNKLRWLTVSLRPTFNLTWQDPTSWSTGHNTLKSLYNVADVHLFPFKGFDVSLKWEYNALEVERGRYRCNSFLDAAVRYAATRRLEFRVQMSNLLDRDTYSEAAFTGLNYGYFSLPLRGREVLFSVAFNI